MANIDAFLIDLQDIGTRIYTFMYTMAFSRGQIGLGAASATVMLATVAAIVVPYLYSELRSKN